VHGARVSLKDPDQGFRLQLLGGLSLGERSIDVLLSSQRVLAVSRCVINCCTAFTCHGSSGRIVETTERQPTFAARSVAWPFGPGVLVMAHGHQIALSSRVTVDLHVVYTRVRRVFDEDDDMQSLLLVRHQLMADLLPDWYEDWAITEQEQYGEIRLRALEHVCKELLKVGRTGAAVQIGLAAAAADPLRETAQYLLISSYLAEGNRANALRQYHKFRTLLRRELELEPSPALTKLIADEEVRTTVPFARHARRPIMAGSSWQDERDTVEARARNMTKLQPIARIEVRLRRAQGLAGRHRGSLWGGWPMDGLNWIWNESLAPWRGRARRMRCRPQPQGQRDVAPHITRGRQVPWISPSATRTRGSDKA
jgi:hypothetical protein